MSKKVIVNEEINIKNKAMIKDEWQGPRVTCPRFRDLRQYDGRLYANRRELLFYI